MPTCGPWEGFLGEQKEIFEQVFKTIGHDLGEFTRLITVEEKASNIRPIASEKELEMFVNTYCENPVRHVLEKLFSVDPEGKICNVKGKEVVFRYYYFNEDVDDMIIDILDTTIVIPDTIIDIPDTIIDIPDTIIDISLVLGFDAFVVFSPCTSCTGAGSSIVSESDPRYDH
ncbi:hypothetical protein E4U50_005955 [Claviceps purpurea]|nr:hypothetical protein E4U50_005955 [Claviceps purpurea]